MAWTPSVGIVGAGIAGLACARALVAGGVEATLFDKGRRVGGRVSTRETGGWQFDHGAQFFTASDAHFGEHVREWREAGLVAPWDGRIVLLGAGGTRGRDVGAVERLVGVPRMQSIPDALADGLDVRSSVTVTRLGFSSGHWHMYAEQDDLGGFDYVVLALPAPQAAALVENTTLALDARGVLMVPCWTVLLGYEERLSLDFDGASIAAGPLSWAVRDASKPGRPGRETWVLQASPDWSMAHLEEEGQAITRALLSAFAAITSMDAPPEPSFTRAHRWRYALPVTQRIDPYLFDFNLGIGLCGDWCAGARIEGAFASGTAMAARLIETCER